MVVLVVVVLVLMVVGVGKTFFHAFVKFSYNQNLHMQPPTGARSEGPIGP